MDPCCYSYDNERPTRVVDPLRGILRITRLALLAIHITYHFTSKVVVCQSNMTALLREKPPYHLQVMSCHPPVAPSHVDHLISGFRLTQTASLGDPELRSVNPGGAPYIDYKHERCAIASTDRAERASARTRSTMWQARRAAPSGTPPLPKKPGFPCCRCQFCFGSLGGRPRLVCSLGARATTAPAFYKAPSIQLPELVTCFRTALGRFLQRACTF